MNPIADLTYGLAGQALAHRVMQGQPSAATFKVFHDYAGDDGTPEFDGTATVDAVDTTLSASAGLGQADPQRIPLTSTAGILSHRKYLLEEDQIREWVSPVEVGAGYIRVRHPLRSSFTVAATLKGTTISAAVDATWVAAEGHLSDHLDPNPDYRVRWDYVVDGEAHAAYSYFDLVRAPVVHGVDIEDIEDAAPGLHDTLPTDYRVDQGRRLIERAWRSLQAELGAMKVDTDAIRDEQILGELVIARTLVVLALGGWRPQAWPSVAEYLVEVRWEYHRLLEKNFQVGNSRRLAAGTSGAAEAVQALPIIAK